VAGRSGQYQCEQVRGQGWWVEAAEMASTNQFFNLVLESFAFFCGVAIVLVIAAIFSHVCVGGSGRLTWWWDEVGL